MAPERREALACPVPVTWPLLASPTQQREESEAADTSSCLIRLRACPSLSQRSPWLWLDAAKQGRAVLACPLESESPSSVGGVACPSIPDTMTTRYSPANFLGWVI